MSKILYGGRAIELPNSVNVDELAEILQDSYAKCGHSWLTFDDLGRPAAKVRLLLGPGIPVGFLEDAGDAGEAPQPGQQIHSETTPLR